MTTLLNGKLIFIVEDNLMNRVVFQMSLIKVGGHVEFERQGRDALYRLKNLQKVDLIVMDLMLAGGISGLDLIEQIRAEPSLAHIPIVAVSAMDPVVAIPQVKARGFNGFIAKPIDERDFAIKLNDVLMGKEVWDVGSRTLS